MDNIEIIVFDEITDYKEKIYFFNIRQWIFAGLIVGITVPTYFLLKEKIGEDITSYIIIAIAGILGFIGFVKIHNLPAEKILPYWFRHYFNFAKPIYYMSDKDYSLRKVTKKERKLIEKNKIIELKKKRKEEKLLEKAKKKFNKESKRKHIQKKSKLSKKISRMNKKEKEELLKLLERE